jgi:Large polyvalent protein associated domain 38
MAYEDDYEEEDYYEPEEPSSDSGDGWQAPEPEEEEFPLPSMQPPAEEQEADEAEADEAENAPPYQVAGAPQPPPKKDEGYVTDPGLLEQLGEPPKKSAADDEYISDPDLLKQLGTPPSRYVEQEGKEPEPRSVIQRAIDAPGEVISGIWDSITRLIDEPTKEEAEKYLGPSGVLRSAQETGGSLLDILFAIPTTLLSPLQSAIASGMAKITPGDKTDEEKYQEWFDKVGTALMGMGSRVPAVPRAYTGAGPAGRYTLGTQDPELPLRGGATRTPDQMRLPLEPSQDQFRPPQPELPLRTPTGEQGQLPLPGAAGPTPAGRVGRALPEVPEAPGQIARPGTAPGELVTPPAPELPGPGGRIAEQTEMPLRPPTGREPAPLEPVRQGELLPPTGEQGQLPFPHQEAAGTAGKTVAERESRGLPPVVDEQGNVVRPDTQRHGTPGSTAAAGTAEAQPPPLKPRPGEPGWLTEARGPEDYGKKTPPREAGGGMNVGPIDPTVASVLKPEAAAAAARPAETVRGPIPENIGAPQKPGGNIVRPLEERPTGELIQLARRGELSPFMRDSLANELERRGIRRMPEPARPEPPNVGAQLRAREATARQATQEATAPGPVRQFLQDERGGGRLPRFLRDERGGGRLGPRREPGPVTRLLQDERGGGKLPTSYERAKKMTVEQLRAELARPDIKNVQRAVFNDALRARGEKPIPAAAAKTPTTPTKTPTTPKTTPTTPTKAPPGRLAELTDRFKKSTDLTPADKAIRNRIAPDPSWTDHIPTNLRDAAELVHRGYEGVFNSVHPMARAAARAQRALGRKLETQEDFHRLARAIKGLGGKIESIYREGPFDPETRKVIGPALNPILEKIMVDKNSFNAYSVARRTVEQEGKGLKTGVPLKEANEIVARDGKRWGQTFQELNEFKSAMMRMGKHLIGEENIKKIEELNKDHVPFYRALDPKSEMGDMFRTGGGLKVKDPIEKYKGSERQILDPMNSTLKNMAMIADIAEKNEVWRAMERTNSALVKAGKDPIWTKSRSDSPLQMTPDQRTRMKEAGIPEDMIEKMRFLDAKQFAPESQKIRYFENGKEQIRDVRSDIARVGAGMDRAAWGVVTKVLGAPKRWLTAGATLNPDFPTKNLFRDQHTAFIQHDAKLRDMLKGDMYIPFYNAATSLQRFFKPEVAAEFNKWMRNGGANAALVSFDRKLLSAEPRSYASKVANVVTHPWKIPPAVLDILRGASEQLENASRFGAHLKDVKKGRDSPTSAFRGRELTVDFPRMGNFVAIRFLSETIPFFNPQLQGMDRYVRSYKSNPTATFVKTMAAITVPSVMLYMYNNRGDPRYDELPMWRKMLFWNIMTDSWRDVTPEQEKKLRVDAGDPWFRKDPQTGRTQYNYGTIWSWPKPFIEGQLAGSIPERIMEAWLDKKPDAFKHVIDPLIDAVNPFGIPQFMKPTTEAAMNYSTFLKRPLMSEGVERKPQEQQFTRNTTETAKSIAGAFRTVLGDKPAAQLGSPIIIDNYIRQLTGGLGDYAVKMLTDPILNLAQGKTPPPGPEKTLADMPIIKGFVSRFPTSGAESIQNFYEMRKDAQTAKAGGDKFVDEGKSFADLLKAQRDGLERIYADKKMSPEDKRTSLDVGTLLMIETARKGVEYMRKMNEAADKARTRVKQNAN